MSTNDALCVYWFMHLVNLAVDLKKHSSQWHLLTKNTSTNARQPETNDIICEMIHIQMTDVVSTAVDVFS